MTEGVYTDGSRVEGKTGAATIAVFFFFFLHIHCLYAALREATITRAEYLGRYATVMDAELLAVAMGWEIGDTVITGSQAAIGRIKNLQWESPRGWIEERVLAAASGGGRKKLEWVKGHSGVMGNELADLRVKKGVWEGTRRGEANIATAAGIRHEFRVTRKSKQVQEWDRDALKGHTYLYTERGPFKTWLHKIGREDSPRCPCGEAAQSAAHVLKCRLVIGGKRDRQRTWNSAGRCLISYGIEKKKGEEGSNSVRITGGEAIHIHVFSSNGERRGVGRPRGGDG